MKVAITGGIACGKSLVTRYLNELGVETLDADEIVHELIPPDERRRLATIVFKDETARRELEQRIHPIVKSRIREFIDGVGSGKLWVVIIPLLFETHWESEYDIICCVTSEREAQVSRMMTTRGYTREEAEARLAAQMPVGAKAEKSHYVIKNDGSSEELKKSTERFVLWLKNSMCSQTR